ncbi:hypothetical protein SO802_017820 [Lithocarpus litseifolius]|uniref:IST1 homolog n=1 Tax=Lithocarpus litseifolius TaxID=425828 RepID=A0AAW2CJ96_9ROSI
MGVTAISRSVIWKVWVVSHHLSTKHCTKIALVEVYGSERMMGLKLVARIWPLVSLVKTWYHEATCTLTRDLDHLAFVLYRNRYPEKSTLSVTLIISTINHKQKNPSFNHIFWQRLILAFNSSMSLLNQLFSRGVFGTKCKTSLNLAISRIKLLQNKRDMQHKHMRKEIAQFLQAGQEAIARIRVEHVIREQNMWAAYEILELFCEFVLARVPIIESQRECPSELQEAIASIIYAAPRCSDLPDLLQIKNLFTAKYGNEFVMAASELRPDSGVNRTIIEKLSVLAPAAQVKLKVLKDIAQEYNLAWDSSSTEAEFSKTHEDLLAGSKQIRVGAALSQAPNKQVSFMSSPSNGTHSIKHMESKQESQHLHSPSASSNATFLGTNEIEPSIKNYDVGPIRDAKRESRPQSTDILEKARAAIASAERASAAARAAAALVNVEFGSLKVEEGKSS